MKDGRELMGCIFLFVLLTGIFRGCGNQDYQYRYNSCMYGTPRPVAIFKAAFVCLWV